MMNSVNIYPSVGLQRLQLHQSFTGLHEVLLTHCHLHHLAVESSPHHSLHLHRLHRYHSLSLLDHIPYFSEDLRDCAGHSRFQHVLSSSLALVAGLHLVGLEPETKLVSLTVEHMHSVCLNKVLLLSDLTVDDDGHLIGLAALDLIVENFIVYFD